jgi:hypothetical protein
MKLDTLLDRLDSVRKNGTDKWIARCPAHDDKTPSLAIKYVGDKILLHCFGGCSADDVITAVGLEMADLFETPPTHDGNYQRVKRGSGFTATDALKALAREARLVGMAARDIGNGIALGEDDIDRVRIASQRIDDANLFIHGLNEYRK